MVLLAVGISIQWELYHLSYKDGPFEVFSFCLQKTENDDFDVLMSICLSFQGFFSFMCPALSLCLQPIAEKVMNLTITGVSKYSYLII